MRTALVVLLVLVTLGATASAATPGKPVAIQFRLKFISQRDSEGALKGTFVATGAINASGRVAEEYVLSAPVLRGQQPVEGLSARSTLTSAGGSLTIRYTGVVSSAAPAQTVTEGTWKVESGTRRFKGVSGRGRLSAIVDLARKTMVKRYDGLLVVPR